MALQSLAVRTLPATFLVVVIALASPTVVAFAQGITGRVASTSGEPLSGVTVWNAPFDNGITDANGAFSLKPIKIKVTGRRLRFQMNGYRPVTKFVKEGGDVTIVMEKFADTVWTPPACTLTPEWLRGEVMAFRIPKPYGGTRGYDVDFGIAVIRYRNNAVRIGYGPSWSWGLPVEPFFDNVAELHERDIRYTPERPAAEYRGKRSDGTYFRFIGMFGETVEYDHATKDQADWFDSIMDTLCWVHEPYVKK